MHPVFFPVQMTFIAIIGLTLFMLLITFIFTCIYRLNQHIRSEFAMYIIISETLFAISTFFSLGRSNYEENPNTDTAAFAQLIFTVFTNTWTVTSGFVYILMLMDNVSKKNRLESQCLRAFYRIIIFFVPFGMTLVMILIHAYHKDKSEALCNFFSCQLTMVLYWIMYAFYTTMTLISIFMLICANGILNSVLLRTNDENHLFSARKKYFETKFELWVIPMVHCMFWFVYCLLMVSTAPNIAINQGRTWEAFLIIFVMFSSVRLIMYLIVFIASEEALRDLYSFFFCCGTKGNMEVGVEVEFYNKY